MQLNKEFVRLYDGELLLWGEVTLRKSTLDSLDDGNSTQESVDVTFHFVIDEIHLPVH